MKSWLDLHQKEVLGGAMVAFLLRGIGAVFAFGLNIAIGRLLGADGAGLYFLALSVVTIGAIVTQMGLANALLRFVASGAAEARWDQVNGVVRLGLHQAGIAGLVGAALIVGGAPWIARVVFSEPNLSLTLQVMGFGVLGLSLMLLLSDCLKGLKQIRSAMLVNGVMYPAIALLVLWPLTQSFGPPGAALAYVIGTGTAALIGWLLWRREMKPYPQISSFSPIALRASSQPLWVMSIINRAVLPLAPLVLLGIWGTASDVGIFGAATRVALLIAFFLLAVNTVIAPKFAELHTNGDFENLKRLTGQFTLIVTLASTPVFLILLIWNEEVMGLFGADFRAGGTALAILVLGQAANTITGTAGHLLMMTGHERDVRDAAIAGSISLLVTGLILVPPLGLLGAAFSTSFAHIVMNFMTAWLAWKRLRIISLPVWRKVHHV